jgi:hypothetical protein
MYDNGDQESIVNYIKESDEKIPKNRLYGKDS